MRKRSLCLALVMILALLPLASVAQERGYETPEACAQALFVAL